MHYQLHQLHIVPHFIWAVLLSQRTSLSRSDTYSTCSSLVGVRPSLRLHCPIIHTVPTIGDHDHQLLFLPLGASAQLHTK